MKLVKSFVVFIFIWAFAVCITAQSQPSKIAWKNLREKYESFYEIEPFIVNESGFSIYYDAYFFPYVDFERFDEKSNSWIVSRVWHCGTGYKPRMTKIKPSEQISLQFGKGAWDEIINEDSIGETKFRRYAEYNGTGKYRFKFMFRVKKSDPDSLISHSPEFEVVEKDFKK